MAEPANIRVLLVDDHELVRRGLRDLLETEPDITVTGEASGVAEACARAEVDPPDVAVLDMRLPDGTGAELCARLRALAHPPACVVLTAFDDESALLAAIEAGASGYLLKQVRGQDMVNGVREVAAGRSLLDPATTSRVLAHLREPDALAELTERERAVLELLGEGLTNREIAERLVLAEKTVKNHVTAVLGKLGLTRRTQAIAWMARRPLR